MSLKRRNTSSEPEEIPVPKRQKSSSGELTDSDSSELPIDKEQPKSDPVYGQRSAFPGLDDNNDELLYGDPSDGIEYLRMVRHEAKGVPQLLYAPKETTSQDSQSLDVAQEQKANLSTGFYDDDEAYIAPATNDSCTTTAPEGRPTTRELYHDSLLARFRLLRATLRCTPPLSVVHSLDPSHLISLPPGSKKAKDQWRAHLQMEEPHMVQLACMDSQSVLEAVKLLAGMVVQKMKTGSKAQISMFGRWTWAVLGRCPDRAELGSEEIAEIRALGKRATEALRSLKRKHRLKSTSATNETTDLFEEVDDVVPDAIEDDNNEVTGDDDNGSTAQLDAAKRRLQEQLQAPRLTENTLSNSWQDVNTVEEDMIEEGKVADDGDIGVILDMVITVVGEVYGQRDLLGLRDSWETDTPH